MMARNGGKETMSGCSTSLVAPPRPRHHQGEGLKGNGVSTAAEANATNGPVSVRFLGGLRRDDSQQGIGGKIRLRRIAFGNRLASRWALTGSLGQAYEREPLQVTGRNRDHES